MQEGEIDNYGEHTSVGAAAFALAGVVAGREADARDVAGAARLFAGGGLRDRNADIRAAVQDAF